MHTVNLYSDLAKAKISCNLFVTPDSSRLIEPRVVISSVVKALLAYPMKGHRQTGPYPVAPAARNLQCAIAAAKASRAGNAAFRAIRLRMYSAIRMPNGAENQMQIRSEAVL
jgi:hypothetical protein